MLASGSARGWTWLSVCIANSISTRFRSWRELFEQFGLGQLASNITSLLVDAAGHTAKRLHNKICQERTGRDERCRLLLLTSAT